MRDKQLKKILKKDFENNNDCPVKLSDVLPEENFKNLNDNLYNKYKKQQKISKYFSISSLITVLVLIISVIGFTITLGDYHSKLANYPILSDEARDYIIDYCDGENNIKLICVEYFGIEKFISIYSITKMINKEKHILYFYETNIVKDDILFICNENFAVSSNKKTYGYIYDFGVEYSTTVELKITYENNIRIIKTN